MRFLALLGFAAIVAGAMQWWAMPPEVMAIYALASIVCFGMYMSDKAAAKAGRWRTSESGLLLMGLACGWPGAVLAQKLLRHKSSKPSFMTSFYITVMINIGLFVYLVSPWSPLRHVP